MNVLSIQDKQKYLSKDFTNDGNAKLLKNLTKIKVRLHGSSQSISFGKTSTDQMNQFNTENLEKKKQIKKKKIELFI